MCSQAVYQINKWILELMCYSRLHSEGNVSKEVFALVYHLIWKNNVRSFDVVAYIEAFGLIKTELYLKITPRHFANQYTLRM